MATFPNDVETAEAVQEQVAPCHGSEYCGKSASEGSVVNNTLSKSSRVWDLDGDGQLDEAELALKALDKSHKGELSKEEMYELMKENLHTQRELFKMKKVVMALVAITCVLALANLGTSFAAAILSKDTVTDHGALVEKVSGKTLKTDSWTNVIHEDKEATEALRRRKMQECAESTTGSGLDCDYHGHVISPTDGLAMLAMCRSGSDVDVQFLHPEYDGTHMEDFCICGNGSNGNYVLDENDVAISAVITIGDHTYSVQPNDEGNYVVDVPDDYHD